MTMFRDLVFRRLRLFYDPLASRCYALHPGLLQKLSTGLGLPGCIVQGLNYIITNACVLQLFQSFIIGLAMSRD